MAKPLVFARTNHSQPRNVGFQRGQPLDPAELRVAQCAVNYGIMEEASFMLLMMMMILILMW